MTRRKSRGAKRPTLQATQCRRKRRRATKRVQLFGTLLRERIKLTSAGPNRTRSNSRLTRLCLPPALRGGLGRLGRSRHGAEASRGRRARAGAGGDGPRRLRPRRRASSGGAGRQSWRPGNRYHVEEPEQPMEGLGRFQLFNAVRCTVRRRIEQDTGRLPTAGAALGVMLDHVLSTWGVIDEKLAASHRVFARDGLRWATADRSGDIRL